MDSMNYAKNIKRIMCEKGISQRELAKKVGTTEVNISRYVSGERCPRATMLNEIAKALEVDVSAFFEVNNIEVKNIDHPAHYQGKNECIDVMIAMFGIEAVKGFCKCNAYKYRFRADKKNGKEDIEKAEWYESKLIELEGMQDR